MLNTATIGLDLFALCTLIGALVCVLWVVPASAPGTEPVNLWRLCGASVLVLAFLTPLHLLRAAADMSGQPTNLALSAVPAILFQTHYGHVWTVRAAALAVCLVLWVLAWRRAGPRVITYLLLASTLVVAWSFSAAGHGADRGAFAVAEMADWVHLLAAGAWGGGLVALSLTFLAEAADNAPERTQQVARAARRFSSVAALGLLGVVLTGIYSAWLDLNTIAALWATPYGRALLVKLGLLVPLVTLAAFNRFSTVPALQRMPLAEGPELVGRYRRRVAAEALLFTAIIACVGVLRTQPPPRTADVHGQRGQHTLQPASPGR